MEYKTENNILMKPVEMDDDGCVVIPGNIVKINDKAFERYCNVRGKTIRELVLPEGLEEIGGYAFGCCCELERLYFPHSLKSIGYNAFQRCDMPEELVIPGNVEDIDTEAFIDCRSIKTLRVESGVKKIRERAFGYCTGLRTLILPLGLKLNSYIYTDHMYDSGGKVCVFEGCKGITDIIVPGKMRAHGGFDVSGFRYPLGRYINRVLQYIEDKRFAPDSFEPEMEIQFLLGCYKAEPDPLTELVLKEYFEYAIEAVIKSDDHEGICAMLRSGRLINADNADYCISIAEKYEKHDTVRLLRRYIEACPAQ